MVISFLFAFSFCQWLPFKDLQHHMFLLFESNSDGQKECCCSSISPEPLAHLVNEATGASEKDSVSP